MMICPTCSEVVRIGHKVDAESNKKIRVCKKCGASLDVKKTSAKKAAKKVEKKTATKAKAAKTESVEG
jgi:DNA-directed RNA polymerase subunit M/transcription elongation factor TFIIS